MDDEEDFVATTKYFLEINGYEVTAAYNGTDALMKAKELPSLILLDIRMPGMTGFEVLRRLKIHSVTKKIPVIILTLKADTQAIFEAKGLYATDYIMKTNSQEDLLVMIKKYIDKDKIKPIGTYMQTDTFGNDPENCWDYKNCPSGVRKDCIAYKLGLGSKCWEVSRYGLEKNLPYCPRCTWYLKLHEETTNN